MYGIFEMGVGKEGIVKLCEMFNMLFSILFLIWYEYEEVLFKVYEEILEE